MAKIAYTLKIHDKSHEMHLFEGEFTPNDLMYPCNSGSTSVCKEVKKSNCSKNNFACKTEQETRELCAKIGRNVCANCIKDLYKTL